MRLQHRPRLPAGREMACGLSDRARGRGTRDPHQAIVAGQHQSILPRSRPPPAITKNNSARAQCSVGRACFILDSRSMATGAAKGLPDRRHRAPVTCDLEREPGVTSFN
jgi:hypothetical protein